MKKVDVSRVLPAYLRSGYFAKIAVLTFLCASASSMISTYLSVFLAQHAGASAAQIGTFVSLSSLAGLIAGTVIAQYTDKRNQRRGPLAISLMSAIVGYSLYALFTSYLLLLAVSVTLIGVSTTITSQLFAYGKQMFDANNAPESAVTIMRTCVSVAWVTSPLAAASLYSGYGFAGLLTGTVLGFAASLGVLIAVFPSAPPDRPRTSSNDDMAQSGRDATSRITAFFIVFVLLNAINVVINTNLPLFITATLGYANRYVGIITSVAALLEIPLMIAFAALASRIQANHLIAIGILSVILYLALLLFSTDIRFIIALQPLKAIFCAAFLGLGISFFQAMLPKQYGMSTVLFTNTTRIGTIVAGGITAMSGDRYNNAFIVLLAASIIALLLFIITSSRKGANVHVLEEVHRL